MTNFYIFYFFLIDIPIIIGYNIYIKKVTKLPTEANFRAGCEKEVFMSLIKERLVEELRYSPYTTVELAKKVGVSPEMITQYRTTDKLPKLETFAALCKALDCSADYILGLTDRP